MHGASTTAIERWIKTARAAVRRCHQITWWYRQTATASILEKQNSFFRL